MYYKRGTNPRFDAKYFSLQPNLEKFLATVDLPYDADHIPAENSLFLLDENDQIVQIRSQQDYERHWDLLKPASGRTPFIVYAYLKNINKVDETLRKGPHYASDGGAAAEIVECDDYVRENLVLTITEYHNRTFGRI